MCNTPRNNTAPSPSSSPRSIMKKNNDNGLCGQVFDTTSNEFASDVSLDMTLVTSTGDDVPALEETEDETAVSSGSSTCSSTSGTSAGGQKPQGHKMRKNVSFGTLEEFSFTVIKGDPNFELAYPMSLGLCVDETAYDIDSYEQERQALRRKGDALRTMTEERRQIIKTCKKLHKELQKENKQKGGHKRRNSIGNGEISRLAKMTDFLFSSSSSSSKQLASTTSALSARPQIRRQNSIGNGEISRLSQKAAATNVSIGKSFKTMFSSSTSSSKVPTSDSSLSPPPPPPQVLAQPTLSFDQIQEEAARTTGPQRPVLRRQNSIGNGEIQKHKMRNGVHSFLKTMGGSFGGSGNSSSNAKNAKTARPVSWHGPSGMWPTN